MKLVIDKCSKCDCGSKRPIVNKRHYLCQQKNHERLHGETQFETRKKNYKPIASKTPIKIKKTRINNKSQKGKEINDAYIEIIKEIDQEREMVCDGCGRHQGGEIRLSHSHIISRQECHNIGKPELIYDKRNIQLHCMTFGNHKGCHEIWEGPQKHLLLDFDQNMKFIKSIDQTLYRQKLNKIKAYK